MKLTSPTAVRALLAELDVQPTTAMGQNFLVDANILRLIVGFAAVGPADTVLEIGAGLGVLTEGLAETGARVVAVEKDRRLFNYLQERFRGSPSVTLIGADFMDLDAESLMAKGVNKVVANLPYSVGSRILMNLAAGRTLPECIVVTVQTEVGQRLAAPPGTRDRGLLSVWAQLAYDAKVRKSISPTCFLPSPKVHSAIVAMTRKPSLGCAEEERADYYGLTKECFGHRRKQLATILTHMPGRFHVPSGRAPELLTEAGLDPRLRPEALEVDDWCRLVRQLRRATGAAPGTNAPPPDEGYEGT